MLPQLLSRRSAEERGTDLDPTGAGRPLSMSERLVQKLASSLGRGETSRRSFLVRVAVAGSAMSVDPLSYILKPGTAYAQTTCGPGATCGEGWSVFCCTINGGRNACPPGSFAAGWWKADNSAFCGGGPRYYIDCNQMCGQPCTCYCPTGTCDNRRTCCNQFRYGQCHQEIACAGPVRCRMVMCTPPWQFDPTCTTASATDNRTALHDAPCNQNVPVTPGQALGSTGWVAINADGRVQLFGRGPSGRIRTIAQVIPNGHWGEWQDVGLTTFPPGTEITATRNADGRLEVFAVAADGSTRHLAQQTPGGPFWNAEWPSLGGILTQQPAVNIEQNGRLDVFGVGIDNQIHHKWQLAPGWFWSDWEAMGGSFNHPPAVARNQDGRLEVFCVGTDGQLWHNWQVIANGHWSGFYPMGGSFKLRPAVAPYPDGRLHVACTGTDGKVYRIAQVAPNSGWGPWQSLGGATNQPPSLTRNQDGRHEIFIVGVDGQLYHIWEWAVAGTWSSFEPYDRGGFGKFPMAVYKTDGRIELFAIANDGNVWHSWQTNPNSYWTPLWNLWGPVSI